MLYKSLTKSKELVILELLNKRKELINKEKQYYFNLKKGYEGEMLFESFIDKLQCECLILNDLLLEVNNTTFQIGSLIIVQGKIYLYEVKNYEGDYYFQSDQLFKKPRLEVVNPLHQLSRSESLLRQLLLNLGFPPKINASIVFINPNFTLYEAPLDKPIIFPSQITRHIEMLNAISSNLIDRNKKLAGKLLELHKFDSPFSRLPPYEYEQLQKGMSCSKCESLSLIVEKRKCVCHLCGNKESLTNAVLNAVREFRILFPDKKITTNIIYNWCQVVETKQPIRRILATHFNAIGKGPSTYYE